MKQKHHSLFTGNPVRQEGAASAWRVGRAGRLLLLSLWSLFATAAMAFPPLPPGEAASIVRVYGTGATGWVTRLNDETSPRAFQWPFLPTFTGNATYVGAEQCVVVNLGGPSNTVFTGRKAMAVRSVTGSTDPYGVTLTVTATYLASIPKANAKAELCNTRNEPVYAWPWLEFADIPPALKLLSASAAADGTFKIQSNAPSGVWTGVAGYDDATARVGTKFDAPPTQKVLANSTTTVSGKFSSATFAQPVTALAQFSSQYPTYYNLQNANSGYCLAIDQNSPDKDLGVTADCTSDTDRVWQVAQVGGNEYVLQLKKNAQCLDLPAPSLTFGAQVAARVCTTFDSQRWYLKVVGQGHQLVNANSGYCLDVENHSTGKYKRVTQGTCDATSQSQLWFFNLR